MTARDDDFLRYLDLRDLALKLDGDNDEWLDHVWDLMDEIWYGLLDGVPRDD